MIPHTRTIGRRKTGFFRWQFIHDLVNGALYLQRLWIAKTRKGAVALHWFHQPDRARDLHDHPWWFVSFVLRGFYIEELPGGVRRTVRWFNFKRAGERGQHSVIYASPGLLTLVIRGPKVRRWGFYTREGFVDSEEYFQRDWRPPVIALPDNPPRPWSPCSGPDCDHPSHG